MISTLLSGAVIALTLSLPPGPITVETIRRGMQGGFRPALWVQLGSLIGDMVWCSAALFGLAPLIAIPWISLTLGVVGVGVLVWLGVSGIRGAIGPHPAALGAGSPSPQPLAAMPYGPTQQGEAGAFRTGMAISLANPMVIGFWAGIGGAMLAAGVVNSDAMSVASFLTGFFAGVSVWAVVMAFAVRLLHSRLMPGGRLWRALHLVCGVALIGLAVALAWQLVTTV